MGPSWLSFEVSWYLSIIDTLPMIRVFILELIACPVRVIAQLSVLICAISHRQPSLSSIAPEALL